MSQGVIFSAGAFLPKARPKLAQCNKILFIARMLFKTSGSLRECKAIQLYIGHSHGLMRKENLL